MAYRKMCDFDGSELGMDDNSFINIWGSVTDQIESIDGEVQFRYLTPRPQTKLAFCSGDCFIGWVNLQRIDNPYVKRA